MKLALATRSKGGGGGVVLEILRTSSSPTAVDEEGVATFLFLSRYTRTLTPQGKGMRAYPVH